MRSEKISQRQILLSSIIIRKGRKKIPEFRDCRPTQSSLWCSCTCPRLLIACPPWSIGWKIKITRPLLTKAVFHPVGAARPGVLSFQHWESLPCLLPLTSPSQNASVAPSSPRKCFFFPFLISSQSPFDDVLEGSHPPGLKPLAGWRRRPIWSNIFHLCQTSSRLETRHGPLPGLLWPDVLSDVLVLHAVAGHHVLGVKDVVKIILTSVTNLKLRIVKRKLLFLHVPPQFGRREVQPLAAPADFEGGLGRRVGGVLGKLLGRLSWVLSM